MRSGVRSPYAPPFIQKGPLLSGPFFIPPQSFLVILATPRRGYGEKIATGVNLPYSALPRTATAMAARLFMAPPDISGLRNKITA